jgi:hypothetical protein
MFLPLASTSPVRVVPPRVVKLPAPPLTIPLASTESVLITPFPPSIEMVEPAVTLPTPVMFLPLASTSPVRVVPPRVVKLPAPPLTIPVASTEFVLITPFPPSITMVEPAVTLPTPVMSWPLAAILLSRVITPPGADPPRVAKPPLAPLTVPAAVTLPAPRLPTPVMFWPLASMGLSRVIAPPGDVPPRVAKPPLPPLTVPTAKTLAPALTVPAAWMPLAVIPPVPPWSWMEAGPNEPNSTMYAFVMFWPLALMPPVSRVPPRVVKLPLAPLTPPVTERPPALIPPVPPWSWMEAGPPEANSTTYAFVMLLPPALMLPVSCAPPRVVKLPLAPLTPPVTERPPPVIPPVPPWSWMDEPTVTLPGTAKLFPAPPMVTLVVAEPAGGPPLFTSTFDCALAVPMGRATTPIRAKPDTPANSVARKELRSRFINIVSPLCLLF